MENSRETTNETKVGIKSQEIDSEAYVGDLNTRYNTQDLDDGIKVMGNNIEDKVKEMENSQGNVIEIDVGIEVHKNYVEASVRDFSAKGNINVGLDNHDIHIKSNIWDPNIGSNVEDTDDGVKESNAKGKVKDINVGFHSEKNVLHPNQNEEEEERPINFRCLKCRNSKTQIKAKEEGENETPQHNEMQRNQYQ